MHLIIGKKAITSPLKSILILLQQNLNNGKLKDIGEPRGLNIPVTCPSHKDGFENRPSCQIFMSQNDKYTQFGSCHCFTCGYKASLPRFVSDCFGVEDIEFGNKWLLDHCETAFVEDTDYLEPIIIETKEKEKGLDESALKEFDYYHDYMWYRKLTKEVVDQFEVGYDPKEQMITFPVRDEKGVLKFITGRSVITKFFKIPEGVEKPVYLLYHILKNNITRVAVCESQINTLYLWSCGIPAVGLFGTGSPLQYELLNKSGIRYYDLYFDGDDAGRKGAERFKRNIRKDVFVVDHLLPWGKDVNDLSMEEIEKLSIR